MDKAKGFVDEAWETISKVGRDDPHRVIHAVKVGLALTLVSLFYLIGPLFRWIGDNAIWAVMTVVLVLEFTAGATLCKGLNRGLGTLAAGSLAFLMDFLATEYGRVFRAIFIGASVFVVGAVTTYMRFFPYIKKNFDYGVVIFLLTFNLITFSSYRFDKVMKIAHERLFTIAIGCVLGLFMSLLVFPNWSGEYLRDSTVSKLEGLAKSIEACVSRYFSYEELDINRYKAEDDPIYKGYKAVLDSKTSDETLALHASWEPRHLSRCYKDPWQQYVELGGILRSFGYTIVALHGCLQTEIQTPRSIRAIFKDPCIRLAEEISKALMELADSIRNRRQCSPEILSDNLHKALQDLNTALKSQPRLFVGPNTNQMARAAMLATSRQNSDKHLLSSDHRADSSALFEWRLSRRASQNSKLPPRKELRPTLSKLEILSLEFSEALPFAAFASLLVETVAKLNIVIEEVEELGRIASFEEYVNSGNDNVIITKNSFERSTSKMDNAIIYPE